MVHVAKHLVAEENKESIEPATYVFKITVRFAWVHSSPGFTHLELQYRCYRIYNNLFCFTIIVLLSRQKNQLFKRVIVC